MSQLIRERRPLTCNAAGTEEESNNLLDYNRHALHEKKYRTEVIGVIQSSEFAQFP
jgi:hypothetical protein